MTKECANCFIQPEVLNKIPLLRYLKDPVSTIDDLYARYPDGGQYGWFTLITERGAIAYWDHTVKEWKLISGSGSTTTNKTIEIDNNTPQETWPDFNNAYPTLGVGGMVVNHTLGICYLKVSNRSWIKWEIATLPETISSPAVAKSTFRFFK